MIQQEDDNIYLVNHYMHAGAWFVHLLLHII